jgi:hypothetical protein
VQPQARRKASLKRLIELNPELKCHVHNLLVGGGEQPFCVKNAMVRQMIDQGRAEHPFEQAHRRIGMQTDFAPNVRHLDRIHVTLGDETHHLLDFVQSADLQLGLSAQDQTALLRFQSQREAPEAGLHLKENDLAHGLVSGPEIALPLSEERGVEVGPPGLRLAHDLAADQRLHQQVRQFALQEPRQRERGHVVLRVRLVVDDLMGNRRPEGREVPGLHLHAVGSDQVGHPAAHEHVELDLIVVIRPPHRRRIPPDAGKSVGREVGMVGFELGHRLVSRRK